MGMTDADGVALSFRDRYQALELPRYLVAPWGVVQKHVALQVGHAFARSHVLGDGFTGGPAVEEVQTRAQLQGLHEPLHRLGFSGQQATHMTAHSGHVGQ